MPNKFCEKSILLLGQFLYILHTAKWKLEKWKSRRNYTYKNKNKFEWLNFLILLTNLTPLTMIVYTFSCVHYVCVKMLSKGVNSPAELWGWHSAKGWSAQRGFSVITQWRIAGKWSETRRGALIRAHSLCINLSPPNTHLRKGACTIVRTRAEERVSGGCVTRHT